MQEFLQLQYGLLEKERDAEMQQVASRRSEFTAIQLQRLGVCLLNLRVTGMRSGLGGKNLVDFESATQGPLIENRFKLVLFYYRQGDMVAVEPYSSKEKTKKSDSMDSVTGVVYRISESVVTVAFNDDLGEIPDGSCKLVKLANEITYQRMLDAIKKLEKHSENYECYFKKQEFTIDSAVKVDFFNENLNESQKEAVQFAIGAPKIALIHGPPGTGKTHTCVEIIRQLVGKNCRILVCGPSNISVDNLVERLAKTKIPMVRLGNPARVLNSVLDHSLDVIVRSCDEGRIVNDVRKEIDDLLNSISKTRNKAEKRQIYSTIKQSRKELVARERKVIESVLKSSKVVLSTLNGAASKKLDQLISEVGQFDVVLIDEASKALEAECWIALLKAKKLILAGDHMQLPPTVKSATSSNRKKSLEYTLFDRLLDIYGVDIKRMLQIQYRMNQTIQDFSSVKFYDSKLQPHSSVATKLLKDLENVEENDDTTTEIVFVDTAGFNLFETASSEPSIDQAESKYNEGEVAIVKAHVKSLIEARVQQQDIAIISPYSAQVSLLISSLNSEYPLLEIGTVDGFQGREKEAILLSMVRSNENGQVGFLNEKRRLNVAITRPKKHLFVVGDSETLQRDKFLKTWIDWLEAKSQVRFPE